MVRIFMPDGGSSGDVAWREVAGDGFELFWSMFGRRACQHGWRVGGDVALVIVFARLHGRCRFCVVEWHSLLLCRVVSRS